MPHQILFSTLLKISQDQSGLLVPIALSTADRRIKLEAFLDTGAKYSVLPRWIGEELDMDIEAGVSTNLMTGAGPMPTYLHYLTLEVGDLAFDDTPVCIAKFPEFSRCLLGRDGWLQSVRVGLVAYDDHLFLSLYDD